MGLYLTILIMCPSCLHDFKPQTDHFANTFVGKKVAHGYVNFMTLRFKSILFGEIKSMNEDISMY